VGNEVKRFPYYLRDLVLEAVEKAYYDERSQIFNDEPSKTDPGRGTLRLLMHYLTAPMTLKECLSSHYVRFIFDCKKMYTDLLTAFLELATSMTRRLGKEALPPLEEFTDKMEEVNAHVHFAKHEYRQKHLCVITDGDGHDDCALHCVAHQLGGCPACKCAGKCTDACHPGKCYKCTKFRRWGVNYQMFLFSWKNHIDRAFENGMLRSFHLFLRSYSFVRFPSYLPLASPPLLPYLPPLSFRRSLSFVHLPSFISLPLLPFLCSFLPSPQFHGAIRI
jgi:hypothetical protein